MSAIAFARKGSSDEDDPNDHSVADAVVRSEAAPEAKAVVRECVPCGHSVPLNVPRREHVPGMKRVLAGMSADVIKQSCDGGMVGHLYAALCDSGQSAGWSDRLVVILGTRSS
jgi:hypothetical protein